MKDWFYGLADKPSGPFSEEEILELFGRDKISRVTLVWKEGATDWQTLGESELAAKLPAMPPPLSPHIQLAPPWRRLAAVVVDFAILICLPMMLVVFAALISASASSGGYAEGALGTAMYVFSAGVLVVSAFNVFLLWRTGQTIGKRAMGVMIAGMDGGKAPLWRILALRIGVFLVLGTISDMADNSSPVRALIGVLTLADLSFILLPGHRTLHDFLAGTIVIRVRIEAQRGKP